MDNYYPNTFSDWLSIETGFSSYDSEKLKELVSFAKDKESKMDRDIGQALEGGHFSEPLPEGEIIGPTEPREDPSGIIIHKGRRLFQIPGVTKLDLNQHIGCTFKNRCYKATTLCATEPSLSPISQFQDVACYYPES